MGKKSVSASGDTVVPDGKTRRFVCTRGCYWNGTRYRSKDEAKEPDVLDFVGPCEIPTTFQFENWEEM